MRRADAFPVIKSQIVVVVAGRAGIERGDSRFIIPAFMFAVTACAVDPGCLMRLSICRVKGIGFMALDTSVINTAAQRMTGRTGIGIRTIGDKSGFGAGK